MRGRNDLCPCGSGKKYKKCCLPADTRRELAYAQKRLGLEDRVWAEPPEFSRPTGNLSQLSVAELQNVFHVQSHAIAEGRLALNDPLEITDALECLMNTGIDRHKAIHQIALLEIRFMVKQGKYRREVTDDYRQALRDLARRFESQQGLASRSSYTAGENEL